MTFRVEVFDGAEWLGVTGMLYPDQHMAQDKARTLFNTMPNLRAHGVRVGESGGGVVWGIGVHQSYTLFVKVSGKLVRRKGCANVPYSRAESLRDSLSDVYEETQVIADNYPIESGVARLSAPRTVLELRLAPLAMVKG